ncbi:hypothetical protein [Gulosibacter bifidus]|uniref:Uncharacterized protein n=1 Tax=Gulosibacter bifidus TaxID=272239 RepID=A0ABW5RIQ4_9MICO|nr:hypothetical protein [Gulosibacter bifidus]
MLASVTIPWGRERLTDKPQGNAWTIDLALLPGNAIPDFVGAQVSIRFMSGATLIGKVSKQSISVRKLNEPTDSTGTREVLIIRVVARDRYGVLATTHITGDAPNDSPWPRGWKPQLARVRAEYIRNKAGIASMEKLPFGELPKLTESAFNNVKQNDGFAWTMQPPYKANEAPNALDMLNSCYAATINGAWPIFYDTGLRTGTPGTPGTLSLRLNRGKIEVAASGCVMWPADRLEIEPGAFPQADFDNRIGTAIVSYTGDEHVHTTSGWQTPYNHAGAAVWNLKESVNTATYDAGTLFFNGGWSKGAINNTDPSGNTVNIGSGANGAHRRAYDLVTWLSSYSTLPRMPVVTISTRTGSVSANAEMFTPRELLTASGTQAIYLAGSKWNNRKDIPRFWQSVGGTYREDGKHAYHDIQLAPIHDTKPRDLRISQLFPPSSTAPLKFDKSLRLSDLSAVTESKL